MSTLSSVFRRRQTTQDDSDEEVLADGDLNFVGNQGGNSSTTFYQEASGAPVEVKSPLGYSVGSVTIIFLTLSNMIGTGIFSAPSSILNGMGSVGLSLMYWFIGMLATLSSLSVYLEFMANFPSRSGSEVVYLEQAYPRPKWFFPTAFAIQSVALSFSSGNSVVLAEYLFACANREGTNWQIKGVAIAGYTVAFLAVAFHTRASYWISNAIGMIKLITLVFIAITGLVVLGGHTRVENPTVNFHHAFEGETTIYGAVNALQDHILLCRLRELFQRRQRSEEPSQKDPKQCFPGYNSRCDLIHAGEYHLLCCRLPPLFSSRVFGSSGAVRGLNFLIALSSFGNLVAVLLGTSRLIRECGRQGVLPWTNLWVSTKPFGTPLGPYIVQVGADCSHDPGSTSGRCIQLQYITRHRYPISTNANDYSPKVTDLQVYPSSFFYLLLAVGIYFVRSRRRRYNLPRPSFQAWNIVVLFNIVSQLYVLIMAWYPPDSGADGGDVSSWYATYIVTGIGIVVLCAVYYVVWIDLLPSWGGYRMRLELVDLGDGAQSHRLVKVRLEELEAWDATHDAVGKVLAGRSEDGGSGDEKEVVVNNTEKA